MLTPDFNYILNTNPYFLTFKKNQELTVKPFFKKIFCRKKFSNAHASLMNAKIKKILEGLDSFLMSAVPNPKESLKIRTFIRKIRKLPSSCFDRGHFIQNNTALKYFLFPNLKALKEEKKLFYEQNKQMTQNISFKALQNFHLTYENHLLRRKLEKNQLAICLGGGIKINKGSSETKLLYRYKKNGSQDLIGVFKPRLSQLSLINRLITWIKTLFGDQRSLLSQKNQAQSAAEVSAYYLDRFFGFNCVPPSIKTPYGLIQLSASSYFKHRNKLDLSTQKLDLKEAKTVGQLLNKNHYQEQELDLFQSYAIHDFLIGNLDGHDENWFIHSNQNDQIDGVVGVDKANSLLRKNPNKHSWAGKKQYLWGKNRIAHQPFTAHSIELLQSLTTEKIEDSLIFLKSKVPHFLDSEMIQNYRRRAEILYQFGIECQKSPAKYTPERLSQIRTKLELASIFKDNSYQKDYEKIQKLRGFRL